MRASALISASAGVLLVLLLLSAGCGQRPTTGTDGGMKPFWESTTAAGGTPESTTAPAGVVVEIPQEVVRTTTPPTPTSTEVTYVEVYNKEYLFRGNTSVLEYALTSPPLLIDVSMKTINLTGTAVERDPTCTPTDTNLCLRTVTKYYPDPNAWFTITVVNKDTNQVAGKTGYGREYDVAMDKRLTIKAPGNYRIEMSGNRLSAVIRMRITIGGPAETTPPTPVPTTLPTTAAADEGVKIIGLSYPRQSGTDLLIPYEGNRRDDPHLSYITVIIGDTNLRLNTITPNGELGEGTGVKPSPQTVLTKRGVLTPGYDHIEVIGYFDDGTEQRFFDTMV
ncbi:MAG: hypothetical protein LUQ64_03320 [Methanomicrobiales archaeon]|nr:hypothetical protein [Methanomicrobiales archaeon]